MGAFLGCLVGMLLIVIVSPMQALIFLVTFLVLQQLEGQLIYPKVVGSSVGLPAIWILVSVFVGGKLFGIVGMLFFIPLTSVVYSLLRLNVSHRLKRGDRHHHRRRSGNLLPGGKRIAPLDFSSHTKSPPFSVPCGLY